MRDKRRDYEQHARALRYICDFCLARGDDLETVARRAVAARNQLKAQFREGEDPAILAFLEARNQAKYGNPLGPSADAQLARYGSWSAVIDAACRPSELS